MIEEACGMRMDCRNLLALPRGLGRSSNTLELARASKVLLKVDTDTLAHHAYPCCREGGGCCPMGSRGARDVGHPSCCSWNTVRGFLRRTLPPSAWVNGTQESSRGYSGPW